MVIDFTKDSLSTSFSKSMILKREDDTNKKRVSNEQSWNFKLYEEVIFLVDIGHVWD